MSGKHKNSSPVIFTIVVFVSLQAINSLNKYPLPLQTAKEAKILQNFGDGICKILDEKLQRYYRDNGKTKTDGSIFALIDWCQN